MQKEVVLTKGSKMEDRKISKMIVSVICVSIVLSFMGVAQAKETIHALYIPLADHYAAAVVRLNANGIFLRTKHPSP